MRVYTEMLPALRFILVAIVALLVDVQLLHAQPPTPQSDALEQVLDADGKLRSDVPSDGSFDMGGWKLQIATDGSPRFVRSEESSGELSAMAEDVPGDECWAEGFGPQGIYGTVHVLLIRGSDMFIGGNFRIAGPLLANNIVRYNVSTNTWSLLGIPEANGTTGPVYALGMYGNDLYVGGKFEGAADVNAKAIARWNMVANKWFTLGSGILDDTRNWPILVPYGGTVRAIAVNADNVYVGGDFQQAGGEQIDNLARWDLNARKWTFPCRAEAEAPNGTIYALLLRDSLLYIGGAFTRIGPVAANRIVTLNINEDTFSPLDSGVNDTVRAIAASSGNSDIYVGGNFTLADGRSANRIARWNGGSWSAIGAGVNNTVRSIAVRGNTLYIGGVFTQAGGISANGVAQWNGAAWLPMDEGVSHLTNAGSYAIAADVDRVYTGGNFTSAGISNAYNIAQWDSTRSVWSALGQVPGRNFNGADGSVYAMTLKGNDLYIGGDFTNVGGVRANRVARYDRSNERWSALGDGFGDPTAFVRALEIAPNGDLYVGGIFSNAGGLAATGIARWDGTAWNAVGGGVGGPAPFVFDLTLSGNDLYVGGAFTTAGGNTAPKIARWNTSTSTWSTLGPGITGDTNYTFVQTVAVVGTSVYAGGSFTKAAGQDVNYIAKWDGANWGPVGTARLNSSVTTLAVDGADLYVGGDFTMAGNLTVNYITRWDGTSWSALGTGTGGPVRAITASGDRIYVGGEFLTAGGVATPYIALWTKSSSLWSSIGGGASAPVRALLTDGTTLFAGGEFVRIGGERANHVAGFSDNGWSSLGSDPSIGLSGTVLAIAIKGSDVYVGGRFRTTGGVRTNGIARWDGERWLTVGGGVSGAGAEVRSIVVATDGSLYVGGLFASAGGVTANSIARWDGSNWIALGSGIQSDSAPGIVNALLLQGNDLLVAGQFKQAGGSPAGSLARWSNNAWSPVGSSAILSAAGGPGNVRAVATVSDRIYVGGRFDRIGTDPIRNLAEFSGGSWKQPRPGTINEVAAMATKGDELFVVANRVDTIRSNIGFIEGFASTHVLTRLSNNSWSTVDSAVGHINTLVFTSKGELYAGGYFSRIGSSTSLSLARWNGVQWSALGSGAKDLVRVADSISGDSKDSLFVLGPAEIFAIAPTEAADGVWVGGNMQIAGSHPSSYFGQWTRCGVLDVPTEEKPQGMGGSTLGDVYPNPTGSEVSLSFSLPRAGRASLKVYSTAGQEIAMIFDRTVEAGAHTAAWDASGVEAGVYYFRFEFEGRIESRSIVVVR